MHVEKLFMGVGVAFALWLQACAEQAAGNVELDRTPAAAGSGAVSMVTPPVASLGSLPAMQPSAGAAADPTPGDAEPGTQQLPQVLPCGVATLVTQRCQQCHGVSPIGGAPMPLVTYADFHEPSYSDPSREVFQLVQERINSAAKPMPPGSRMADPDLSAMNAWLQGGALSGSTADAACPGAVAPPIEQDEEPVEHDPNEVCYDLRMHGGQTPGDTSKYRIEAGEYYRCFYFAVPWTSDVEGTRYGNLFEHEAVLHHWLLYTTSVAADGTSEDCFGSHIGDTAQLLAGWAVGGNDLVMPDDVGFQLPPPGTNLLLEWHIYNTTNAAIDDASGMQVCTVPKGTRLHPAGITWLGTEAISIPAGQMADATGTCVPGRAGMNASDAIHIFNFLPHMHKLGRHMRSVVNRANGQQEEVFSRPFDFNQQIDYAVSVDLYPGDSITSTCTFFNDTPAPVGYGNSSDTEMCYQFAMSYPVGALQNGAFGLNGASNDCW